MHFEYLIPYILEEPEAQETVFTKSPMGIAYGRSDVVIFLFLLVLILCS